MGSASAAPGLGHVERCLAPEWLPQGCQRRFQAPLMAAALAWVSGVDKSR